MKKIAEKVLKFRYIILAVYAVALILSFIGMRYVTQNSNLTDYLPTDIESVVANNIIKENFKNDDRTIRLLVVTGDTAKRDNIQTEVLENKYVSDVFVEQSKTDAVLFKVVLDKDAKFENIEEISSHVNKVLTKYDVKGGIASGTEIISPKLETNIMMIGTFGAILLVIILFSKSFFDPFIILGSVGISILLNSGTNYFLGTVSTITFSAAALIQLTVSVDYSLFVLNNYRVARSEGLGVDEALPIAVQKSSKSVLAGAITTIAGFIALMFMDLELGRDLGVVLAKGIAISLVTALILVPILIKIFNKVLEKLEHRPFTPSFKFIGKLTGNVQSSLIAILTIVLAVFAFMGQNKVDFIYGEPPIGYVNNYIHDHFEKELTYVIVFKNEAGVDAKVLQFAQKIQTEYSSTLVEETGIMAYPAIEANFLSQVTPLVNTCKASGNPASMPCMALSTQFHVPSEAILGLIGNVIPEAALVEQLRQGIETQLKSNFISGDYQRVILNFKNNTGENEGEAIFKLVEEIRQHSHDIISNHSKVTGMSAVLYDMRTTNRVDYVKVTLISLLCVGLVILLAFKSITVPIILLLVIQSAIWVNIATSFVLGNSLVFMGVIIVSSIQLGATIDYSILLTEKFEDKRYKNGMSKKEALFEAISESVKPILTSGLALTLGGLMMNILQEGTVAQLGLLLGRGAFISLLISLFVMPHFLFIFDWVISKTSLHSKKDKATN